MDCFFVSFFLIFFFSPEAEFNSILREIVLVMRNCCIVMSEIELVFWRAEFRCSGSMYLMLLFKKLYLIQIFNQYLLNKKDDTLRPMDTNLSTWIELSLWRSKRCHEHSMVKFVSTRGYPIPHICVCITEQVYIGQFLSLHFKPAGTGTKASSATDQRMYHTKYIHAPWNYQMNLRVSLWFLFCFVFI